jgi:hypothetical protein
MRRALLLAAALLAVSASSAEALTTTIGQAQPSRPDTGSITIESSFFQNQTDPGTPSYAVPPASPGGPWTLTAWTVPGGTGAVVENATMSLLVIRPTGVPEHWTVAARTAEATVLHGVPLQTFNASIPVLPGDRLGLSVTRAIGLDIQNIGRPTDDTAFAETEVGTNFDTAGTTSNDGKLLSVSATLTAPDLPAEKKCKKKKRGKKGKRAAFAKKKSKKNRKKSCKKKRKQRK